MNRKLKVFIISIIISMMTLNVFCINSMADIRTDKNINDFETELKNTVPKLLKRYNVPGTAIGLIENGKVVCTLNYGLSDKKHNKPVDDNTIFQVASVSKSITALGVMHLVDQGKIKLDDPAEKYLTRWHIPASKFDKNKVTIRRLLSHTAGLSVHGYGGTKPGKKIPSLEESLSNGVKIIAEPGSKFMYSGGGYTVLQLIVEEVTKKPFDEYMHDEILKPLGMEHSTYSNNFTGANMSKSYGVLGQLLPNYNFTEEAAAGLKTMPLDFMKFMIASMDEENGKTQDNSIIKGKTLDTMHTPVKADYGLGCFVDYLSDGSTLISHGGADTGWRAQYGFIPKSRDGFVAFTNSGSGLELTNDVMDLWIKYETGTMPQQYNMNNKIRNIMTGAAVSMGVLLLIFAILFVLKVKNGKRVFLSKVENKSYIKLGLRLSAPLFLCIIWCLFFYVLDVASDIPYAFNNASFLFIAWTIFLFITGLFPKTTN